VGQGLLGHQRVKTDHRCCIGQCLPGVDMVTQGRVKQVTAGKGDQIGAAKPRSCGTGGRSGIVGMEGVQQVGRVVHQLIELLLPVCCIKGNQLYPAALQLQLFGNPLDAGDVAPGGALAEWTEECAKHGHIMASAVC